MQVFKNCRIATPLVIFVWFSLTIYLGHAIPAETPYGCHKDYCWTTCYTATSSGWCYTTAQTSRQQLGKLIYCEGDEGRCNRAWACEGPCKTDGAPEELWEVIRSPQVTAFGAWGGWDLCPPDFRVTKVQLKVLPAQGDGDDSGINGIILHCTSSDPEITHVQRIKSRQGPFGILGEVFACPEEHWAIGFELRSEKNLGNDKDDSAAANFRLICDDGTLVTPKNGLGLGQWTLPQRCSFGSYVCGIRTQVEPDQGNEKDDTALNNVDLRCCRSVSGNMTATTPILPVSSEKVTRKLRRGKSSSAILLTLPNIWLLILTKLIDLSISTCHS